MNSYTANGPSGGSVCCSSNLNGTVTNTNQLTTIGTHTISCTVTTTAGKKETTSKTITITYKVYTITNLVENGSFENGIFEWGNIGNNNTYNINNYIKKIGNASFQISTNESQSFARANYSNVDNLQGNKIYAKVSAYTENTLTNPGLYL